LRLVQRGLARRRATALDVGGYRCPSCGATRLVVTGSLALPAIDGGAAIDLEALACRRCPMRAVGVRAGASHRGYPASPVAWGRLSVALASCPGPGDRACPCPVHARFGAQDGGAWRGLDAVPHDTRAVFAVS
jgi:hypothetical protein